MYIIDKVLEYDTDADANTGIQRELKAGFVCVGHSVASVTSGVDKRVMVAVHALSFTRSANITGGQPLRTLGETVPKPHVPQTLRDLHFDNVGARNCA